MIIFFKKILVLLYLLTVSASVNALSIVMKDKQTIDVDVWVYEENGADIFKGTFYQYQPNANKNLPIQYISNNKLRVYISYYWCDNFGYCSRVVLFKKIVKSSGCEILIYTTKDVRENSLCEGEPY